MSNSEILNLEYFVTPNYYLDEKVEGRFCDSLTEAKEIAEEYANKFPGEEVIIWDVQVGKRAYRCYIPEPTIEWEEI